MAFLTLKKEHHMDKPIIIELTQSPGEIIGQKNKYYDKIEFIIKVINIGSEYLCAPKNDLEPYKININQEFDFIMTETLFSKINNFEKGEKVFINMAPGSKGMVWVVQLATENDINKLRIKTPDYVLNKNNNNDRGLEIKWGMAFNNATKLVAQTTTSIDQKDMVKEIKRIIAPMFQVACGMEKTIDFLNKKQKPVEKPIEEKTKEEIENELF
jgi:hypothetical protein